MNAVERILGLLETKEIQQKDLAKELGFKESNISDWKSGKSKSYMKYIYQMADYFDVSPFYLLCKTDDPAPLVIDEKNRPDDTERNNLADELIQKVLAENDIDILRELSNYSDYLVSKRNHKKK